MKVYKSNASLTWRDYAYFVKSPLEISEAKYVCIRSEDYPKYDIDPNFKEGFDYDFCDNEIEETERRLEEFEFCKSYVFQKFFVLCEDVGEIIKAYSRPN